MAWIHSMWTLVNFIHFLQCLDECSAPYGYATECEPLGISGSKILPPLQLPHLHRVCLQYLCLGPATEFGHLGVKMKSVVPSSKMTPIFKIFTAKHLMRLKRLWHFNWWSLCLCSDGKLALLVQQFRAEQPGFPASTKLARFCVLLDTSQPLV